MLWKSHEHEPLTDRPWSEPQARDAIGAIVADAEAHARDGLWPQHPRDEPAGEPPWTTLYLGSAGMIWALHQLGTELDLPGLTVRALEHYRHAPDMGERAHPPSFWVGEVGILSVAERVGSPAADRERLRTLIRANREHPTWELMWGSPGTILAARALGLDGEAADSATRLAEEWDPETDLWRQTLARRPAHVLGPAHGLAGNVHALRGHLPDHVLRARASRALERAALREDGLVNWPPSADPRPEVAIRVQWCHGAPGIVTTIGDLLDPELTLGAGELCWQAGPLRKGPSLCHGTAGNGYAFLKLHALTGDEHWLERAWRFAMHAIEQVAAERERLGRGRHSLMTGDIGVALYLAACLTPDPAFPTIDDL